MKSIIYCFVIGLFFLSLPVHAEIYNVSISSEMVPDSVPVFGFNGPFTATLDVTIDTDSGFDVFMPGSAWSRPGPDLYGYEVGAISMSPLVVGTATFGKEDIVNRVPVGGYSAAIWFDAPLSHGASPNVWIYFDNADGTIQFGGGECSSSNCQLVGSAYVWDNEESTGAETTSPITVQVTNASPKSIPSLSEWGVIIMSLLLAGSAVWMIRRRQIT